MSPLRLLSVSFLTTLAVMLGSCSSNDEVAEVRGEHSREGRGEHDREGRGEHGREGRGEHGREGGEESGTEFALNDTYDHTRNGARLKLRYDRESNAFVGTVQNTTKSVLKRVRVEVHLSNGKELGPTMAGDLGPGEKKAVRLAAESRDFEKWSAHPEVGSGEYGGEERHR
jgi:hypothetical protein